MNRVIPIANQQWNLAVLREVLKQLTGSNLSTNNKTPAEALIVLSKMQNQLHDEEELIRRSELVQKHSHHSFLIVTDWESCLDWLQSMRVQNTMFTSQKGCVILASADLEAWRNAIITGLSQTSPQRLRLILKDILFEFERIGFANVFHKYRKSTDGVLYLELK